MNCPNPNCNTKNLPDEARFCPECGTMLHREEPVKKMTITECRLVPNLLKQGEQCKLQWKGTAVKTIVVDNIQYSAEREIYVTPTQSRTYYIGFIGEIGKTIIPLPTSRRQKFSFSTSASVRRITPLTSSTP